MRRLLFAALLLAGCYTPRHIVVPPTEIGQLCARDAHMHYEICVLQQRGWVPCAQRRDDELLSCPDAYETTAAELSADAGTETPTYTLPGYKYRP